MIQYNDSIADTGHKEMHPNRESQQPSGRGKGVSHSCSFVVADGLLIIFSSPPFASLLLSFNKLNLLNTFYSFITFLHFLCDNIV